MGDVMQRESLRQLLVRFGTTCLLIAGVSCNGDDVTTPSIGTLEITSATTGTELDDDGYTISIDGGAETSLGANATIRHEGLEAGNHTVQLAGLAPNCVMDGDNPRTIEVPAEETVSLTVTVSCGATTGSLEVSTSTGGGSVDADGYTWALDAGDPHPIGINETALVKDLRPGSYSVTLSGLATNCHRDGDDTRAVTVSAAATARVSFTISCVARMGTKILFKSTKDGLSDLYVMNTDGSAKVNLTSAAREQGKWNPGDFEWSHDGRKIAFVAIGPDTVPDAEPIPSRVFVMNAEGGDLHIVNATPTIYLKAGPRWSPDDRKIMFYADYGEQIYVMSSEGGGVTPLGPGRAPVWSPDGTRIAFEQARRVSVMNADGSARKDLGSSASNDHSVTWSPDGSRIAFVRDDGTYTYVISNLWCMNADGSDLKNLTNLPAGDAMYGDFHGYSWSPDGSKLALAGVIYFYEMDIFLVPVIDGGFTRIAGEPKGVQASPRWAPDGTRILFSGRPGYTVANDIYIMNADGSDLTRLTNPSADQQDPVDDEEPEWQPGS